MNTTILPDGVTYAAVAADYFEKRSLRRYAGIWSLWALGVGAVISGRFSGWNLGLAAGGRGGMLIAAMMFLALSFCIAEMSASLPFSGGSYSFARLALGPFWGFVSGL